MTDDRFSAPVEDIVAARNRLLRERLLGDLDRLVEVSDGRERQLARKLIAFLKDDLATADREWADAAAARYHAGVNPPENAD